MYRGRQEESQRIKTTKKKTRECQNMKSTTLFRWVSWGNLLILEPNLPTRRGLSQIFGDKFGESLGGSQAPPSFWEVPGLPRKFPELPRKFSATSPEVPSLLNLTAIPRFPGSSPNFPRSSGTSPEVSPFLWEAWHPLLTHKNFLWITGDENWTQTFFSQTLRAPWSFPGKIPGCPAKKFDLPGF